MSNDLIVATFVHFAPNAVDISNSMSSRGLISVILKSRSGIWGSVGRIDSYHSFTSSNVASLNWKVSFSTL